MFLIKNDNDILTECGFLKDDYNHLSLEFRKVVEEENEVYLNYIKNEKD